MNNKELKTIFYGTSEFGLPILEWLFINTNLQVVVTTPDKFIGRKKILAASPVKQLAESHGIKILQPDNLRDKNLTTEFQKYSPDVAVVASYGKIIPKNILELPKYKSLNLHPSLLPKFRGATPIRSAILAGENLTGTTLMLMDELLDHGHILVQEKLEILPKEEYVNLHQRLSEVSKELLADNLFKYIQGEIKLIPQDHKKATFTKQFTKKDGLIDWSKTAEEINRMVRALNPWPGSYSQVEIQNSKGKSEIQKLKVFKLTILQSNNLQPKEIQLENEKMIIGTKDKDIEILEIQLSGKNKMKTKDFLQGFKKEITLA